MTTYGRNFEFRKAPYTNQRGGRYAIDAGNPIPLGCPITVSGTGQDAMGMELVALADNTAIQKRGISGILVEEKVAWDGEYPGIDPVQLLQSNLDTSAVGAHVQMVSGDAIKVLYRNVYDATTATAAQGAGVTGATAHWAASANVRRMIADADLAGLAVGDFLEPSAAGSDTAGYWQTTATEADAWLVVTRVDLARAEFEAELTF